MLPGGLTTARAAQRNQGDSAPRVVFDYADVVDGALSDWLDAPAIPIEVEIGSASGHFLSRMAAYRPTVRFLGVELNPERCTAAGQRVSTFGLKNVRIVTSEASALVSSYLRSSSITAVHIYFPTPYPRSIGLASRLIGPLFVRDLYRILVRGGSARIVTDHEDYFEHICTSVRTCDWWHVEWDHPLPTHRGQQWRVGTPCEKFYFDERRRIREIQLVK